VPDVVFVAVSLSPPASLQARTTGSKDPLLHTTSTGRSCGPHSFRSHPEIHDRLPPTGTRATGPAPPESRTGHVTLGPGRDDTEVILVVRAGRRSYPERGYPLGPKAVGTPASSPPGPGRQPGGGRYSPRPPPGSGAAPAPVSPGQTPTAAVAPRPPSTGSLARRDRVGHLRLGHHVIVAHGPEGDIHHP
jgi:hypothetical protein